MRHELDKEPLEEGALVAEELGTDEGSDIYRNSPLPEPVSFSPNSSSTVGTPTNASTASQPSVLVIEPIGSGRKEQNQQGRMALTPVS